MSGTIGTECLCCGSGGSGIFGAERPGDYAEFVRAAELDKFDRIWLGGTFAVGICANHVFCWGSLGRGTSQMMLELSDRASVYCGWDCAFLVEQNHRVYVIGQHRLDGLQECKEFVEITDRFDQEIAQFACGWNHFIALCVDRVNCFAWGSNKQGQLGLGDFKQRTIPEKHQFSEEIQEICCGMRHTAVLDRKGNVWVCGDNRFGQLAKDTDELKCQNEFSVVKELSGITQISSGWHHILALNDKMQIHGWGKNSFGQLGLGNYSNHFARPTRLLDLHFPVLSIHCGSEHSMAIIGTESHPLIYTWGWNEHGNLSLGDTNNRSIPHCVDIQVAHIYWVTICGAAEILRIRRV
jgi:alpha-tubulin suppressor-like RCC1 family protein